MREIKFRAWSNKWNKMVFHGVDGLTIDVMANTAWNDLADDECIELMQYTGLKDKNGKEIYEGDIMESVSYSYNVETKKHDIEDKSHYEGVVTFGNKTIDTGCEGHGMGSGSFLAPMLYVKGEYGTIYSLHSGLRIIGNIYENKDLIKS